MKKSRVIKLVLLVVITILFVVSINLILGKNVNLKNNKQIIKEMNESTQVLDLQTQINTLNASHEEYAKNVQVYKAKIAEAITNQGVNTSADSTAEVMSENIGKILQAKTTATATASQILKGQTAWVNGNKVTGTMVDRGELNWNPTSSTTYNVPTGYYSGGTLSSANAYNTGYNDAIENATKTITITLKNTSSASGTLQTNNNSICTSSATGIYIFTNVESYSKISGTSSDSLSDDILTINTSASVTNKGPYATASTSTEVKYSITFK